MPGFIFSWGVVMGKKAIVFVDSNNWYHNLKKDIKPGSIDILKTCDFIAEKKNLEILEIRWYASMPDRKENELIYKKQRAFLGHLEKRGVKIITRKLQKLSTREIKKRRLDFISSWDLCESCRPIVEDSFLDIADYHKKEKGIDVWIAVDMVDKSLNKKVDCCVLISGDADFVPALELVKKNGKDVLSTSVSKGYSSELRQKFPFLVLKREDLIKCLKDYEK